MRSVIIESGVVVNVIEGSIDSSIECQPEVGVGWLYDGSLFSEPVVLMTKQDLFNVIASEYQALLDAGITYNGSTFQSDAASITALNEVLTAIANGWGIPANFAWIDSSDVPHVADLTFLKGLAIALADHKAALFARLQVAKAALRSATTQAEIEAITL